MNEVSLYSLKSRYPVCCAVVGERLLKSAVSGKEPLRSVDGFARFLGEIGILSDRPYLKDLVEFEAAYQGVRAFEGELRHRGDGFKINPSLEVLRFSWRLIDHVDPVVQELIGEPAKGEQWVLVWKCPFSGKIFVKEADREELLAIKMVSEELDAEELADRTGAVPAAFKKALKNSARKGLLLESGSRIERFISSGCSERRVQAADIFTLQWHITNACDLRCRHCYDRTDRSPLTVPEGERVLDDLISFCDERNVSGHVCFTGGNPFMHPGFFDLYSLAAGKGFTTAVLGNPVSEEQLLRLREVQIPEYYQVSLEGFRRHNDYIRGEGHFDRTLAFLQLLKKCGIPDAVMLTLTGDNMDQVIPLANELKDRVGYFTFNRLSQVGEGADLLLPGREAYRRFLERYVKASEENPVMGFKDNLINIVLREEGDDPFDGCTGYGCGAAFNFITVLPDGEAHACRKFPSRIGNIIDEGLEKVYTSVPAERYRNGPRECVHCELAPECRGCMASTYSKGKDVLRDKDPFCWYRAENRRETKGSVG